jgi:V8-like Glu-specific endopeptidase
MRHAARARPLIFKGFTSFPAVTALALLAAGNGFAQQPSAGETKTIERSSMPTQAEQDINKYQTREGRLQAKPLDWNTTVGTPSPSGAPPPETNPNVPGGTSAGGAPNPRGNTDAQRMYPGDWPRQRRPTPPGRGGMLDPSPFSGNIQLAAGSPDIFTQYGEYAPAVNPDAPISVGKLFSNAGTCTASVVSPKNAIVTAAHCCWDRRKNNWIGGWAFSPAYNNGNAPYGTFNWSTATILTSWINNGDVPSDVCVIRLQNDRTGRGVTYYTGWLGRSWDWGSDQEHHALGYPGNIGNANLLEACTSESFSPSASCGGSGVLNMGCSMTYGSSGGPWIRNYRSDNWVNAVVHGYDSSSCTGTFGKTFNGPRFTSGNIATVCNAAGC